MILVIPDVHGRDFWREPCSHLERYSHVVFLGDYVDPYGFEDIDLADAFDGFNDIVALAEKHPDKVTLLLGNHDLHYFDDFDGRSSRYSYAMAEDIGPVFEQKRGLFHLACQIGDTLFTHAGCTQQWIDEANERYPELQLEFTASSIDSLLGRRLGHKALMMVSNTRGGWFKHGSCVWADVSEHLDVESPMPQVFGHTMQATRNFETGRAEFRSEVVRQQWRWMMLDCARAFELDEADPFNYTRIPNPKIDTPS